MDKDYLKNIYETLKKGGYKSDYNRFVEVANDPNKSQALYDKLYGDGIVDDDWDTYKEKIKTGSKPSGEAPWEQTASGTLRSDAKNALVNIDKQERKKETPKVKDRSPKGNIFVSPEYAPISTTEAGKSYDRAQQILTPDADYQVDLNRLMMAPDDERTVSAKKQLDEAIKANEEAQKKARARIDKARKEEEANTPTWLKFAQSFRQHGEYRDPYATDEEMQALRAERNQLDEARKTYDAATRLRKAEGFANGFFDFGTNFQNIAQGIKDVATSPSFMDGGASDLSTAAQLVAIKDKLDKGKPLTKNERRLFNSTALSQEIQQAYGGDLPSGYTAGGTTAQMLPFALQMASNPISGAGKAFARQATKKFGKDGIKALTARVDSRVGGDVLSSAYLASTTQGQSTASDILNRYRGSVKTSADEQGRIQAQAFQDGDDLLCP